MTRWYAAMAVLILGPFLTQAQAQYTQDITLNPGWNAIYLEVVPDDNDIEAVFAGVPIASVWRFLSVDGVTGVPANPSDGLAALEGWHAWFPDGSGASALTDLFTVRANNAYLINLSGDAPATVGLTGTPVVQPRRWAPDAFTLTGFGVDPGGPPTFGSYFAPSLAHAGQPIYTLAEDGAWRLADTAEAIRSGAAYWVFTRGPTEFQGPLEVQLDPGFRDLDFGAETPAAGVTIINRALASQEIRLTRAAGGLAIPLVYEDVSDPQSPFDPWVDLDTAFPLTLATGRGTRLNIAPLRANLQFNRAEQVLEFTNLDGARVLVPAAADLPLFDPAVAVGKAQSIPKGTALSPRAGLWVGTASINEVNQTQSIDGTVDVEDLFPTAQEMDLRVIVHIDADDNLTLVSQVVQLFENGSAQNVSVPILDANNQPTGQTETESRACVPGRSVLITRDELFSNYQGLSLRGDGFVGLRLSTVAYEFAEVTDGEQQRRQYVQPLALNVASGRYETAITYPPDSASNPFFHRFHPDHDNRDAFYEPLPEPVEVPMIQRTIGLTICDAASTNPECDLQTDPAAGSSLIAGKFHDRVDGLHKNSAIARGDLRLRRLTTDSQLNPAPLDLDTCVCDDQGICP